MSKLGGAVFAALLVSGVPFIPDASAYTAAEQAVIDSANLFVDPERPNDDGDGKTPATAKQTIQAAVDVASANDVILLLPGVYSEGGREDEFGVMTRVLVTNVAVTVRGLPGHRDDTIILGAWASTTSGTGADAVRCAYVTAENSVFEGVTFKNGATASSGTGRYGGGLSAKDQLMTVYAIDCRFDGCCAARGGAMGSGRAHRCLFVNNYANGDAVIGFRTQLSHCVMTKNSGGYAFAYGGVVANCTFADNSFSSVFGTQCSKAVYNCLFANSGLVAGAAVTIYNCVADNANGGSAVDGGGNVFNATSAPIFAPARDDWRVLTGTAASTNGLASNTTKVALPSGYTRLDYNGEPVLKEGASAVGAVQEVADAPASGRIDFNGDFAGDALKFPGYAHYPIWPTQICVTVSVPENKELFGVSAEGAATNMRFPDRNGKFWFMPPPTNKTDALKLTPVLATAVLHADPDGTDGAYTTLQDAVDAAATGTKKYTVIHAAEGRYADGGAVQNGIKCRVAINNRQVRIIGAGRDKSFIVGEGDPNGADGLGAEAVRCGSSDSLSAIQGFTFVGGCSGTETTDNSAYASGFYGSNDKSFVLDCDFLSCTGKTYAVVYNGDYHRCRFVGCRAVSGSHFAYVRLVSCLSYDSISKENDGSSYSILQKNARTFFCTVIGQETCRNVCQYAICYCSIFDTASGYYVDSSQGTFIGNLINNLGGNSGDSGSLYIKKDPLFADTAARDYHIASTSPAIGPFDDSRILSAAWAHATSDLDGKPLVFTDGKVTLGCYQSPATVLTVKTTGGGQVTVDGKKKSTAYVSPGKSVTIGAVLTRPFEGFEVGGDRLDPAVTNYIYTASEGTAAETVNAVFGTDWYVDAANGDDARSGAFRADARKTLAGAFACNVQSGDTVNALPGVYSNETMTVEGDILPSRVVIPAGVSLVATGTPEETVILGERDKTTETGLGSGAVRCVRFASTSTSRVSGFTLAGGATYPSSAADVDRYGSAVYGTSHSSSVVENCVVSNNVAYLGTGSKCCFCRCRIVGNRATYRGAAGQNCDFVSCLINGNNSDNQVDYAYRFESSTIGPDVSPSDTIALTNPRDSLTVLNSLILGGKQHSNIKARNSAFVKGNGVQSENLTDCIVTNAAALEVDENFVPVVGRNVAIDRGNSARYSVADNGETDLAGNLRIMNGAMDIGCFEADWKPVYSKILGRGVTVTAASSNVVAEVDGKSVKVPAGQILALDWTRDLKGEARDFLYRTAVTGEGALSVTVDGGEPKTVTATDDPQQSFRSADESHALTFAFDEGAEGSAELSKFTVPFGLLLMVR